MGLNEPSTTDELVTEDDRPDLPYSMDKPADASQVVQEITRLATLVAAIVGANPSGGPKMIDDWTKEPGRSVGVQSLRLSLALESYVGVEGLDLIKMMGEMVPEMVGEAVGGLEKAGYLHLHPAQDVGSKPREGDTA